MNARKTENTSELIPLTKEEMTTIIGGATVDNTPTADFSLSYQTSGTTDASGSTDDPNEPIDI